MSYLARNLCIETEKVHFSTCLDAGLLCIPEFWGRVGGGLTSVVGPVIVEAAMFRGYGWAG